MWPQKLFSRSLDGYLCDKIKRQPRKRPRISGMLEFCEFNSVLCPTELILDVDCLTEVL